MGFVDKVIKKVVTKHPAEKEVGVPAKEKPAVAPKKEESKKNPWIAKVVTVGSNIVDQAGDVFTPSSKSSKNATEGNGPEHNWVTHSVRAVGSALKGAEVAVVRASKTAYRVSAGATKDALVGARTLLTDAHLTKSDLKKLGGHAEHIWDSLKDVQESMEDVSGKLSASEISEAEATALIGAAPRRVMVSVEEALQKAKPKDAKEGAVIFQAVDKYAQGREEAKKGFLVGDPFRVGKALVKKGTAVVEFSEGVWKASQPTILHAKEAITNFASGFQVEEQIAALQKGESYELKVGGNVHIAVGVEAAGALKVSANRDGTYTVTAGGELGFNSYLETGGKINLGALKVSAIAGSSAHLTGGANLELTCQSAKEAVRAAQILEKLGGAMKPEKLVKEHKLSEGDAKFLKEHASSVELSGSTATEVGAALGLFKGPTKEVLDAAVLHVGANGGFKLKATQGVKVHLSQGQPTGLTVKQVYAGEAKAEGNLKFQLPNSRSSLDKSFSGNISTELTIESIHDFPKELSLADFQENPLEAIKMCSAQLKKEGTTRATLRSVGEGTLGAQRTQLKAEATFTGRRIDVLRPGVFEKAMKGDFAGAALAAGEQVKIEGTLGTCSEKRWGVEGLGFSVFGVGAEGTCRAVKTHDDPPRVQFSRVSTTESASLPQ